VALATLVTPLCGDSFAAARCLSHEPPVGLNRTRGTSVIDMEKCLAGARACLVAITDDDSGVDDDDSKAMLTTAIRHRLECDATAVRLKFDRAMTTPRPTLRSGCRTAAYINK